jgi:hypothetical protein
MDFLEFFESLDVCLFLYRFLDVQSVVGSQNSVLKMLDSMWCKWFGGVDSKALQFRWAFCHLHKDPIYKLNRLDSAVDYAQY